jgi:hypothetical protein
MQNAAGVAQDKEQASTFSTSKKMDAMATPLQSAPADAATLVSLNVYSRQNFQYNVAAIREYKGTKAWKHGPPILEAETAGRRLTGRKQFSHETCPLFTA